MGNVGSVCNAFEAIGISVKLSNDPGDLKSADCLVLPGVGAFEDGILKLKRLGLVEQLNHWVLEEKKPFLGICVGLQLLASRGFENGTHAGLGWIPGDVIRFDFSHLEGQNQLLKIPHVGWNDVTSVGKTPLTQDPGLSRSFYFVHSYYLQPENPACVIGTCDYGVEFPAMIQQDNIFAVQFHPEKSQKNGLAVLQGFIDYAREGLTPALGGV
ncbi:MAG: imidazole glycerol phosphate synthase subunit HisH [Cyanobacteria bacterium]|nr:imidazole glycerol phosphate synthase subunit HisH [Cyanobacteriota bacterium]